MFRRGIGSPESLSRLSRIESLLAFTSFDQIVASENFLFPMLLSSDFSNELDNMRANTFSIRRIRDEIVLQENITFKARNSGSELTRSSS